MTDRNHRWKPRLINNNCSITNIQSRYNCRRIVLVDQFTGCLFPCTEPNHGIKLNERANEWSNPSQTIYGRHERGENLPVVSNFVI